MTRALIVRTIPKAFQMFFVCSFTSKWSAAAIESCQSKDELHSPDVHQVHKTSSTPHARFQLQSHEAILCPSVWAEAGTGRHLAHRERNKKREGERKKLCLEKKPPSSRCKSHWTWKSRTFACEKHTIRAGRKCATSANVRLDGASRSHSARTRHAHHAPDIGK